MAKKIHICLDLGNQTFKLAAFEKVRHKLKFLGGLVEPIEFNIADSFKKSLPQISAKLLDMISKLGISANKASINLSLPGSLTFTRLLKLPSVDHSKVHQMVQYEAQQQIPFSLNEVIWDYKILGSPNPEHLHVLLVAVREEWIRDLLGEFQKQNLHIERIESSPVLSYINLNDSLPEGDETVALMNIGAHSTNFMICSAHTVWVRSITVGGDTFSTEIKKGMNIGFEEAESLKIKKGNLIKASVGGSSSALDEKIQAHLSTAAQKLATELMRSISFFNAQFHAKPISKLYLTGGSSQLNGMDTYLSQELSIQAERFHPFKNRTLDSIPSEFLEHHDNQMSEIAGLAMQIVKPSETGINLLPKSYIRQQAISRKKEYIVVSAVTAILILLPQILYQRALLNLHESRLKNVVGIETELKYYASELKKLSLETDLFAAQIHEIKRLAEERARWLSLIQELQKKTPPNIWLEKFTTSYIQKENVPASGSKGAPSGILLLTFSCKTTGTYKDVSNYRDILESSPLFQSVQIKSANPPLDAVRYFVIQTEWEGAS